MARTTDIAQVFPDRAPWKVADFTYDEMLQLDAGSWKGPEFTGEKIPTLTEAIEVIRVSRTGLLLEVKAPELYLGIEADVARTMRAVPGYLDLPSSVVHVFRASGHRPPESDRGAGRLGACSPITSAAAALRCRGNVSAPGAL